MSMAELIELVLKLMDENERLKPEVAATKLKFN